MAALMHQDSGTITVLGHDNRTEATAIHHEIGYMPQRFGLYEDLTIIQNLRLYADLKGLGIEEREAEFEYLLTLTDLKRFSNRLAGRLSGGMKQKLGLACALLKKPRLLLLDEPGVGVDPISRRELWKMVSALSGEGVAVVWSTAYLDEAELCPRVLLLNEGKLLFAGPPQEMTQRTANRVFAIRVAAKNKRDTLLTLLGEKDVIDGTVQGNALRVVMAKPQLPGIIPDDSVAEPVQSRFEDSFIEMLGGGPDGHSLLAAATHSFPMDDPRPVIEAKGLTKRYGDFIAASNITFNVKRGEIFGLLGPNGAGKSTTFKMLCGLVKPTEGEGLVAGYDLRRDGAEARNRLGYMAQKFSLYGDLSVGQNLTFFAGVYGLRGSRLRERTELMMEIFALKRHQNQSALDLPLGLKQRLALACAVMHEPDVLFLDEPTSGVDPVTRREFWMHINGLVRKGMSILVTTHFMDEAEYCDRISLVYRGQSIAMGSPDDLKAGIRTEQSLNPTMEDAFVTLIRRHDSEEGAA